MDEMDIHCRLVCIDIIHLFVSFTRKCVCCVCFLCAERAPQNTFRSITHKENKPQMKCEVCNIVGDKRKVTYFYCDTCKFGFHPECFNVYHNRDNYPDLKDHRKPGQFHVSVSRFIHEFPHILNFIPFEIQFRRRDRNGSNLKFHTVSICDLVFSHPSISFCHSQT